MKNWKVFLCYKQLWTHLTLCSKIKLLNDISRFCCYNHVLRFLLYMVILLYTVNKILVQNNFHICYGCWEAALRGVLRKRCSRNMQQIYRRTPMQKCNFNKVAKQLHIAAYFQNTFFLWTPLKGYFWLLFVFTKVLVFIETKIKLPKVRNNPLEQVNPQVLASFLKTRFFNVFWWETGKTKANRFFNRKVIGKTWGKWYLSFSFFFCQKQPPEVFYKKLVLKILQYSQENTCVGKHLCWSLFLIKL